MNKHAKKILKYLTEEILIAGLVIGCSTPFLSDSKLENKINKGYNVIESEPQKKENFYQPRIDQPKHNLEQITQNITDSEREIQIPIEKRMELINQAYSNTKELPNYLDKFFVYSLINCESSWRPNITSSVGAKGLGQLLKETWKDYKNIPYEKGVYNPELNIEVVLQHLKTQENFFKKYFPEWESLNIEKKQDYHSAAYNCGLGKLRDNNFNLQNIPEETRKHIVKIRKNYNTINS